MVCVEAGYVSEKYTLPGEDMFEASQTIRVAKL